MSAVPMSVRHDPAASRYELLDDGELIGVAEYEVRGTTSVFSHTVITPSRRGQGFGAELVRAALDDQRAQGRTIVPQCWYVAQFIDEHPEYTDLLAS